MKLDYNPSKVMPPPFQGQKYLRLNRTVSQRKGVKEWRLYCEEVEATPAGIRGRFVDFYESKHAFTSQAEVGAFIRSVGVKYNGLYFSTRSKVVGALKAIGKPGLLKQ